MNVLISSKPVFRQARLFYWRFRHISGLAPPHTFAPYPRSLPARELQSLPQLGRAAGILSRALTTAGPENGTNLPSKDVTDYKVYRLGGEAHETDWVKDLELTGAISRFKEDSVHRPLKVLVLYGSLRLTSYSRFLAFEFARILDKLGADVRVYNPEGLPVKDDVSQEHPKVAELRELSQWSEAHVWCCPEQHGTITAVFKNQIDWIPLSLGSVRPTQGRTLAVAQVNGGSQSFNTVNTLRVLGRWMRMITIPNQSSVPKAWTEFDSAGRMKPSSLRDRVVDVAEELFKFSIMLRDHSAFLVDRYSERKERREKGRLLSQAEKEAEKMKDMAATG